MTKILVINAGSSSQKCSLFIEDQPIPIWQAIAEWSPGQSVANIKITLAPQAKSSHSLKCFHFCVSIVSRLELLQFLLDKLCTGETQVIDHFAEISIVGHRVVHGGETYRNSVQITPEVKASIANLIPLAPVHNPANLEGIEAIEQIIGPQVPQVAVFDTAFHSNMPDAAAIYPTPYSWVEKGIRRYGFHGISHQYCAQRAAQIVQRDLADLRIVTCHLGHGCSLAAIAQGQSIDTTMGFTPLDGLMMGTRSGSVDPSILIHLMRTEGYTHDRLDRDLNHQSGLLGISGVSSDLRLVLEAIASGNSQAQLAFDLYIHSICRNLGSMIMSLSGLDILVFTAGVGENSAVVRELVCRRLKFLGLELDLHKNQSQPIDLDIATPLSQVRVLVIHTQEDWSIAQACITHIL